jgi:hypothetical protein
LLAGTVVLVLLSGTAVFADLDQTKMAVAAQYTEQNKEQRSQRAIAPASEMIEFNLAFADKSGKLARVWFKDDKSVMESRSARRGLADYEITSLQDRNVGTSNWLSIPVGQDLAHKNHKIWLRKDRLVAAFLVRKPSPGPTRIYWRATSFTVGYLDVLKVQINEGDQVGDPVITRQLWKILEDYLAAAK